MFKRKPISPGINDNPKDQLDIIDRKVYDLLFHVKWVLVALFVYLTILTISEGVFMLQNINDNAVGRRGRPWETNHTYHVSDQNQHLESFSEIINM